MAIHNYFVLGCIILAASSSTMAVTSADLSDPDLKLFQESFKYLVERHKYTCDNYEEKCTQSKIVVEQNICRVFANKYTCDNATDLEGTRAVLKKIEKFYPPIVDNSLPDLRKDSQQEQ